MDLHYGITDSKPWKWSRRQTSRQMSFKGADYYSGEVEYAAAVAAAAFAISSLESATRDQRRDPRTYLEKTKSQKEPIMARPEGFTDEYARRKGPRMADRNESLTEKIIRQVPSMKRTPTFSGSKKYSEDNQSRKPDIETQIPDFPPQQPTQFIKQPSRVQESEADAWERAQLDKIKQRYEKLNMTILEWEDKKRKRAERKLASTEGELGKRRAKALQNYQNDIERIKQVADGARAQVKEKRRKEEMKVKEKANKFRRTGQVPITCLCF